MPTHKAKSHQVRAEEAIRIAAYRMGVSHWLNIVVSFDPRAGDDRVACETLCDWEYRQVSFMWNLPILASMTDRDVWDTAVHEVCHALIAPLWDCIPEKKQEKDHIHKLHELATENVARAFRQLMEEEET